MTQYVQTTLTSQNGLPQNSVQTITQTRDGYLWFGTEEGLARYDGLRVTVFDTVHYRALKDSYVDVIASGRDGSLWIGSRSGLIRLKDGIFHTYLTAHSPIAAIYEGADDRVWVGGLDGLYAIQGNDIRHYTTQDGLPGNVVTAIVQETDGTLLFGTDKGLASLRDGVFHRYPTGDVSTAPVIDLARSRDASLWVATTRGLFRWKGKLLEEVPLSGVPEPARVTSLLEDREGTLWIGFDHRGIASFRDGKLTRYTARQGLPSDDVASIYEDSEGHLWVGFSDSGAVELRKGSFSTFGRREGLSEDMVWSVLKARDGSLWVGTDSHGLDHIDEDGHVRVLTTHDGLPSDSLLALLEDRDKTLWAGSESGALSHLKDGHVTVFRDPSNKGNRLVSILQDSAGDLWLGFHELDGLVRFQRGHFQHYAVPGLVNTATIAPDGSIWVGTDHGGVSRFQNGTVRTYTTRDGLLSNFAQAVYVDHDGVVWAGTSPGGLNRIKNGHITTYSIEQGLFDLTVGAIIEDDSGNLWMTCNKGIYKVPKKELNDYADGRISVIHSTVYGTSDGLRSAECNFEANPSVWKGGDGRLWFATTAGIASVDPRHSQAKAANPPLLIEHVLFNRSPVPFQQEVVAGPGSGDLEIQFTAPDFVAPGRIRFRYRLRGFDTDWVEVGGRRQAFYTKLPPGHYQFELQATNAEQGWNSAIIQVNVELKPHLWQTEWFRCLCGLILLLAFAGLYRLRVRYLVERNRELEERVTQRTLELQDAIQVTVRAHSALHEQATKDSLTKLWNRGSLFDLLEKEILRAQRESRPIAVLMVDVDRFKLINDTYGHVIGDVVLKEVARRIQELIRDYDFAGRYGGEEFIIVLPGCSLADGLTRAEEFRGAIANTPIATTSRFLQITCSFGAAVRTGSITAGELIHAADEAMYRAKRAGGNRVQAARLELKEMP